MVKSELHLLEKLIDKFVSGENAAANHLPLGDAHDLIPAIIAACSDLKEKWVHQLFSSGKEHVVTRYVQYHQAGITSLCNRVSSRIPAAYYKGISDNTHHIYFSVASCLDDLLDFLKQGFYRYFDRDYTVSANRYRVESHEISSRLSQITSEWLRFELDPGLAKAIASSFKNKIGDARQSGISYRQLDYCNFILATLSSQLAESSTLSGIEISRELYRLNFNSYHFNQWYQQYLGAIINAATENKREAVILQEIEHLKLIFVERDKIFEPELPPINDQLLRWLEQLLPAQSILNFADGFKSRGQFRMPLNFSVTQFALFIRLCYLEGCFHINNISDILRFFTQHFETKKQLNISFKSFARTFYVADQATAAVVRDFLQRMINTINKIYFP